MYNHGKKSMADYNQTKMIAVKQENNKSRLFI